MPARISVVGSDSFEKTLCRINTARNREQEPVEGWINDADRIMPNDVWIVFGIHPSSACKLQQTGGVKQHTPEVRYRRTSARRVTDRIAENPESRHEDERDRPQIGKQ